MDGMAAGPPHRLQKCSNSVVGSLIICRRRDVRYWHLADMPDPPHMSAFGGKADIALTCLSVRL